MQDLDRLTDEGIAVRVLHLPHAIASYASHTVRGLRENGIDARGLVIRKPPVVSTRGLKVIELPVRMSPLWVWRRFLWLCHYLKCILWADVIHWYDGYPALPWGVELWFVKALKKPAVVEYLGSDIRIHEIEVEENPYYGTAFQRCHKFLSLERSRHTQKQFAEAGFCTIVPFCMERYVQRDICKRVYVVPQRIVLSDYNPVYPKPETAVPLIVHSPSAPIVKGTPSVLKAIEKLKAKHQFEFRLVQGKPRHEALQLVQLADIFLDQFVLGSYGMAAVEAMAYGKPVVCYIRHSMIDRYPPDCPIINANQDNLADVLEPLLKDGQLRHEIGIRSRAYVERHHDAIRLAGDLLNIYRQVIQERLGQVS